MTAYGRAVVDFEWGRITVDIQSVNRRFLEMNVSLPKLFSRFEMEIRKTVTALVGRGMVNVSVAYKSESKQALTVTPNLPLAHALKEAWEKLARELRLNDALPLALLAQEQELFIYDEEIKEEALFQKALSAAVDSALKALLQMKRDEGKVLEQDLRKRKELLEEEIGKIEAVSEGATEKFRQKLVARLEELFPARGENEERVLREVAVFAEKVDITEEITRFKSHLAQLDQTIDKPMAQTTDSRGKLIDFLLQELLREINTIGSKSSDLTVSQRVVKIKSELEKIREQVQNIE